MSSSEYSDDEYEEMEDLPRGVDRQLFEGIDEADVAAVQRALRNGADVNAVDYMHDEDGTTPLFEAISRGLDEFVRLLLDAGADAQWRDGTGWSALMMACKRGGGMSIVEMLINHDNDILNMAADSGWTPLLTAISKGHLEVAQFLMERGAIIATTAEAATAALIRTCTLGNLEAMRLLLAAGVDVDARDRMGRTALHLAMFYGNTDIVRELILQYNANMFVTDDSGNTPFGSGLLTWNRDFSVNPLLEMYGSKWTIDYGRLALHAILDAAEYSFDEDDGFHPPLNPLRIILPLGKLTVKHWRTLIHSLDNTEQMIRSRDDTGMMPIHVACLNAPPVEVLAVFVELDPTTLHMADNTGELPLHEYCSGVVEFSSVKFLVDQGGVGTVAARNQWGAFPLHYLCGSPNPPLGAVQYLIQSLPESVSVRTNAGLLPFMIAACKSSAASLSVIYELVRTNPSLLIRPLATRA